MDDRELLNQFVQDRSQSAFGELVERHLPVVFSTAQRMVQDASLAEEVAQNVFTTLAHKAGSIRSSQVLGGWLYNTTRHLALHVRRAEARRREREQTAFAMQSLDRIPDAPGLAEQLEPAMEELDAADRDALVLRFLTNRALREVGNELGISEEAARKRVARALDRLRLVFQRRGITTTAALLGAAMTTTTVSVPAALGASITTAALASNAAAAVTGATLVTMKWLNVKAVAALAASILVVGGGAFVLQQIVRLPSAMAAAQPAGDGIHGTIRTSNGQPVAGAKVYLSSVATPVPVYSTPPATVPSASSGSEGQFSFPGEAGDRAVIVISEKGYGQATVAELAKRPELTLQPWARVEGTLRQGTERLADQTIHLSRTRFGSKAGQQKFRTVHDATTKTDADGNYVFSRVAPGDTWISWRTDRGGYDVQYRYFDIQPGQTLTADIGGRGRAVVGRAVLFGSNGPVKFYGSVWPWTTHQMRRPPNWSELSPDEQEALTAEYEKSPDAKIFNQERCPIDFRLATDGAFTVPDLPTGRYRITVAQWAGAPLKSRMLGRGTTQIIVPEMPTGRSDEPLDVGVITAYSAAPLQPGERAPDFEGRTLEDRPLKLSDYLGKFVLVHFWRGIHAESLADAEHLKAAQKSWGKEPRFVLLGLNFDSNVETAKEHAARHGLAWTHCFLGENPEVIDRYRLRKPTTMLIGTDGRILKPDLGGADITSAIEDALSAK